MRSAPRFSIIAQEDPIRSGAVGRPSLKDILTLIGKNDVANLTFAKADRKRTAIAVETFAFETGKLGVTAAREQRRLNKFLEVM